MKRIEKIGLKSFSLARAYVEDLCENETLVKWKPSNRSVLDCSIPSKQKTANMVFNCLWINEFKSFSPTFSMSTNRRIMIFLNTYIDSLVRRRDLIDQKVKELISTGCIAWQLFRSSMLVSLQMKRIRK